ncbi:MAG TPA: hypothetical protein PKC21_01235 [Oligoflexia bacterium]|nr:hypothetical protein [Oligoflexia bacterium]HMR23953.1 hypothetical protein [Oligoflexia bacterium]
MNNSTNIIIRFSFKFIFIVGISFYSKVFSQNINQKFYGITVADSYYFKPKKEAGDFNIGLNYINQWQKNIQLEVNISYAIEGLNEFWLQPKLNIVSNQYSIKPYFSCGGIIQFQPERNYGANMGIGFIFPLKKISPFLFLRFSNQVIVMAEKPNDIIWEFFQLGAMIEF